MNADLQGPFTDFPHLPDAERVRRCGLRIMLLGGTHFGIPARLQAALRDECNRLIEVRRATPTADWNAAASKGSREYAVESRAIGEAKKYGRR